jgi:hypothetical protein
MNNDHGPKSNGQDRKTNGGRQVYGCAP